MSRSKVLAAALIACLPLCVHASPGWYAGVDVGKSKAKAEISDFLIIRDSSDEASGSSTGFHLHGGYQFGKYFALELGLADLGDFEFSFDPDECPIGAGDSCPFSAETSLRGVTLNMVVILPLGERWSLNARLGMSQMHVESRQLDGGDLRDSTSESGLHYGIGVGYKLDDHWQFQLTHSTIASMDFDFGLNLADEFGAYDLGDTTLASIGVNYHW
jgi:OmpA-OmpF porin, OOP family